MRQVTALIHRNIGLKTFRIVGLALGIVDLTDHKITDTVIRGGFKVQKNDTDLDAEAQGSANLAMEFEVVNNSTNPVVVNGQTYAKGEVVFTGTTNEQGVYESASDLLPYGDYILNETKAPVGYTDRGNKSVEFTVSEEAVIIDLTDDITNEVIRGGFRVQKKDTETATRPQGDTDFAMTFEVVTNNEHPVVVNGETYEKGDVVYTNCQAAGAYRGYGATQGIFAVETAVNELAAKLGMDPVAIREKNMVQEGQTMSAYYNEVTNSCALNGCMDRAKEMFNWEERKTPRVMPNGKVRAAGVAMAMQGSGISGVDVGSATIKLNDEGFYALSIGAADMGTGCDTILAQMAAECLDCDVDNIVVFGADSDASPYDSGSYASSTTYVTGKAVEKACLQLKENMCQIGAQMMNCSLEDVDFDGQYVYMINEDQRVSIQDIATKSMSGNNIATQVTVSHSSPVSPPPFMVGMVEIELDKETGQVDILDYVAVVDCGTVINTNLARVQTEGGIVQGIGMALYENVQYSDKGVIAENSFMQYKIPTRLDMGKLRVDFVSSYEDTGPFGAKSIGEIVINTPSPALANAIYNATGVWQRDLPMTPEKILMSLPEE